MTLLPCCSGLDDMSITPADWLASTDTGTSCDTSLVFCPLKRLLEASESSLQQTDRGDNYMMSFTSFITDLAAARSG